MGKRGLCKQCLLSQAPLHLGVTFTSFCQTRVMDNWGEGSQAFVFVLPSARIIQICDAEMHLN